MPTSRNDAVGRMGMTHAKRIELLEHDREQQSRVITELVETIGRGFSDAQLAQIRSAMREELADSGLRIEGAEHQDEARRDFMFLRSLRMGVNSTASKIGWTVILAITSGIVWLIVQGANLWKGS